MLSSACVFVAVGSLLGSGFTHIRTLWCGGGHKSRHLIVSHLFWFEGVLKGYIFGCQGTEAYG